MSNPTERYKKLCLEESLPRSYRYPIACKELSFIVRGAYAKLPKHLQSLIYQHTLSAIRLLPEMQSSSAVAAAHRLLQSAEAAFPKQKKSLVVTEFKQAKVALKRRSKAHRDDKEPAQLPEDVLVHIFGFLDLQSLISAGLVCRSWNLATKDNHLWELQYTITNFERSYRCCMLRWCAGSVSAYENEDHTVLEENVISRTNIDWKENFKKAYKGCYSKNLMTYRGFCGHCNTIVWLENMKCSNIKCVQKSEGVWIDPFSPHQVVDYLLDGYVSAVTSSDSDSESDEELVSKLWAYPRGIRRIEKRTSVWL